MKQMLTLVAALLFAPLVVSHAAEPKRPNILILLADDLGYADLGCQGSTEVPSPHIDSIAAHGVRFTDGYITASQCAPSRAGLLTGRYQNRFGYDSNDSNKPRSAANPAGLEGMPVSERTMADRLKAAGYVTGMIGKWHLGSVLEGSKPFERGFDETFWHPVGGVLLPDPKTGLLSDMYRGPTPVQEKEYSTDAFGREAVEFIGRHRDKPFFLYVAFVPPHLPLEAKPADLDKFAHIRDGKRRTMLAMMASLDENVGRVLDKLRETKLEENTLVFFLSDNGGTPRKNASLNVPCRGWKGQMLEGGIRVPFLAQWKGRLPAGEVYRQPVISLDIMPTALAAAGVEVPPEWKLDGVDLLPNLTGAKQGAPHESLYWRFRGSPEPEFYDRWAIRQGDWKLVKTHLEPMGLYNLATDIGESKNLAAEQPDRVAAMKAAWELWNKDNLEPFEMGAPAENPPQKKPADNPPQKRAKKNKGPAPIKKPNILVIFTDDLDFEEVAALADYGNAALAGKPPGKAARPLTPQLDRLVGQGQLFTQFYVASTVCTPSRYALLTGQYASRSASLQEKHPVTRAANVEFNTDILPGQWQLARALKAAGYKTGLVGKWHNTEVLGNGKHSDLVVTPPISDHRGKEYGSQDPALPENARRVRAAYERATAFLRNDIGWDYVSSIYMNNANGLGLPKPLWEHESNMEWFTAGVLKFLEQQKGSDKPFFLYLAPNIPHGGGGESFARSDPRATPEGLVDWHLGVQPSRADVLRRVQESGANKNMAWATWLDDGIGVILQRLDDLGLAKDTIVIFSSDHQSRGKWTCYEGARVPLLVRWPGHIEPGSRSNTLLSSVDVVPTLLELAGARLPEAADAVVDGRSFAAALTGGGVKERPVFVEMGYGRAIISDGWKYIAVRFPEAVKTQAAATGQRPTLDGAFNDRKARNPSAWPSFSEADQLFDLRADPMEQKNLAGDPAHAAKLAGMKKLLREAVAPLPHVYGEFKTAR